MAKSSRTLALKEEFSKKIIDLAVCDQILKINEKYSRKHVLKNAIHMLPIQAVMKCVSFECYDVGT